jgi:hypothetical protein
VFSLTIIVEVRAIGVMRMRDEKGIDDKTSVSTIPCLLPLSRSLQARHRPATARGCLQRSLELTGGVGVSPHLQQRFAECLVRGRSGARVGRRPANAWSVFNAHHPTGHPQTVLRLAPGKQESALQLLELDVEHLRPCGQVGRSAGGCLDGERLHFRKGLRVFERPSDDHWQVRHFRRVIRFEVEP